MRSLSTNALGQPNDTIPMVGWFALRLSATFAFARSGRRFGGFVLMASLTPQERLERSHFQQNLAENGGSIGLGTNFPALGIADLKDEGN